MIDNPGRRDLLLAGSSAVLAAGTLAPLHAAAQTAAGPATGPAPARELRILLLNPNSSPDFTRIIAAEARRVRQAPAPSSSRSRRRSARANRYAGHDRDRRSCGSRRLAQMLA